MPGEKEKIKPINITKTVGLTGGVKEFENGLSDFNETCKEIRKDIVAKANYKNNVGHTVAENTASLKDVARVFNQVHGETIKKELEAMLAGPKKHSFDGALEWLQTFPHVMAAYAESPAIMRSYKDFSEEHMELAIEWKVFAGTSDAHNYKYDHDNISDYERGARYLESEKSLYDKAWKVVHKTEKTKIDSIVEKLENAKTFYNSDEYNQIIDVAKMLYHTDELPKKFKDSAKTPEAIHAFKLASIKVRIDAYIEHKAKDGVKPNVYHKLAAVEELNRYVSEELNRIGVKHIPGGFPAITTVNGQVPMSLKEEPNASLLKSYHAYDGSLISDEREECCRTLDCMGRIMLSANALNLGEETMGKLDQLATAFQNGPDVDLNAPQEDTLLNDNPDEMPVIDC